MLTVDGTILVSSSQNSGIEIVVTEFTSSVGSNSLIVTEDGTVGVPFSDSRGVGTDGLFNRDVLVGTETSGDTVLGLVTNTTGVFQSFSLQDGGSVGLEGEGRNTGEDGVGVEELDSFEDLLARISVL